MRSVRTGHTTRRAIKTQRTAAATCTANVQEQLMTLVTNVTSVWVSRDCVRDRQSACPNGGSAVHRRGEISASRPTPVVA